MLLKKLNIYEQLDAKNMLHEIYNYIPVWMISYSVELSISFPAQTISPS